MSTNTTVTDLVRHSLRLLLDKRTADWADLWADDSVLEFPFAPEGWPERLEGRAAISEYMRHYPDHIDLHDFPEIRIHQTTDPETAVVEMRAEGRLVQADAPFDMSYIAVMTARDGSFMVGRDYWNPLGVQQPGADFTRSGGR